ncbi:MAG: type II/IV secretion system ATPase subunit [Candidatus Bathyarchaeia archaeon]|jgi:flagellar protein FlaI
MRDTQLLINKEKEHQKDMPAKEVKEVQKAFEEDLQKLLKEEAAKSPSNAMGFTPVRAFIPDRTPLKNIYPIIDGKAYAVISTNHTTRQTKYEAVEPTLNDEDKKALKLVRDHFTATIDTTLTEVGGLDAALGSLKKGLDEAVSLHKLNLEEFRKEKLMYYLARDYLDYDKIDIMMKDPYIEDISCNGPNVPLYIWHRVYESIPTNIVFDNDSELDSYIIRLAYKSKRMISVANPILDAALPDGSRAQMTYSKYATKQGSTFTIRKFKADPLTIIDLIKNHTISAKMAGLFWYLVENKISIFCCGGVASGKTTMLNGLSTFIAPDAKIITIEDTPEVQLYHENWIRAVTRPSTGSSVGITLFDLLKAAMRQRPDYILVGEIRGEEAYTLFQAMSTGHLGLATLHAESTQSALRRLETEPMNIPRMMIAGLNMVVIMARRDVNGRPGRRILTAAEVQGLSDDNEIIVKDIFDWDPKTDTWNMPNQSFYLKKAAIMKGITLEQAQSDIDARAEMLTYLVNHNKRGFKEVTQVIRDYMSTPESAREALMKEDEAEVEAN